jgi:hypothetical protein
MADEPSNLVLELLRAIRENQRAGHNTLYACLSARRDRVIDDVRLIKRRLELVDA